MYRYMRKKKILIGVCVCCSVFDIYKNNNAASFSSVRQTILVYSSEEQELKRMKNEYNDDTFGGLVRQILYSEEELKQMKNDFGCISRLHKLIYVHIPKTGGTTFERSELMEDAVSDLKAGLRRPLWGHRPIFNMQNNAKERGIDDFHTAATIRHPCSRFISAFRYLKSDICGGMDKKMRQRFGILPNTTLDEYVQYLEDSHWDNLYMHFIPQYQHVVNQNMTKVDVDNILCNEQWDEGVQRLKSVLGIEMKEVKRGLGSTSDHVLQNKHEKCQDLKPETRAAIERFYAMDYCLFGYDIMPPAAEDEGVCIGTENNGESMTKRFQDCKKKLDVNPRDLKKVFHFFRSH